MTHPTVPPLHLAALLKKLPHPVADTKYRLVLKVPITLASSSLHEVDVEKQESSGLVEKSTSDFVEVDLEGTTYQVVSFEKVILLGNSKVINWAASVFAFLLLWMLVWGIFWAVGLVHSQG